MTSMICSNSEVKCGYTCLPGGECCVGGNYFNWGCTSVDAACYTVSNVVGCYQPTSRAAAPTHQAKCMDYEAYLSAAGCPDGSECFYCTDVYRPSCATDYFVTGTRTLTRDLCAANSYTSSYYASVDALYAQVMTTMPASTGVQTASTGVRTVVIIQTSSPQSDGELSGGAVAGIVIGVVAVLVLVVIAVVMVRRGRTQGWGQGAAMHGDGEEVNAELDETVLPGVPLEKTGALELHGNSVVELHGNSIVEVDGRPPALVEIDGHSVSRY